MSENENKTIPNDKIKSDKKPNVPNLRFKGFNEEWANLRIKSNKLTDNTEKTDK